MAEFRKLFIGFMSAGRGPSAVAAAFCSWFLLKSGSACFASDAADDHIFRSTNLIQLSIEISEEGMQQLRNSQSGFQRRRNPQIRPQVRARVVEGSSAYTNVAIQVKGTSSFRPVDSAPSLTLNFDKFAPNQTFHGLTKISLNNSAQDPTLLHEKFSRELFVAAGVPVPRSDHAIVTLNGRTLGLYVLAEGYSPQFLKRYFKRTDGNLYDPPVLTDIDGPLEVSSGNNPTNHSALAKLIAAAREPDPEERLRALECALDMDKFLSMVAIEAILCHSDSYSMNRNNYRVYHDPSTDKMVFMPHGMDRILGTHRSSLDLAIVPPLQGLVARAVLATPEGRRRYLDRAGVLFTNLFRPERLCQRVREIDAKITGDLPEDSPDSRFSPAFVRNHARFVADLCSRITKRAEILEAQFEQLAEAMLPAPMPEFDADGAAPISDWKPKRIAGHPRALSQLMERDGKRVARLVLPEGARLASMRSRMTLPAGTYMLLGKIEVSGPESEDTPLSLAGRLSRVAGARYGTETRPLDWSNLNVGFEVEAARAPEELEFICDIRTGPGEVWFDASSVWLVRLGK